MKKPNVLLVHYKRNCEGKNSHFQQEMEGIEDVDNNLTDWPIHFCNHKDTKRRQGRDVY